jgi:hypothetical protein
MNALTPSPKFPRSISATFPEPSFLATTGYCYDPSPLGREGSSGANSSIYIARLTTVEPSPVEWRRYVSYPGSKQGPTWSNVRPLSGHVLRPISKWAAEPPLRCAERRSSAGAVATGELGSKWRGCTQSFSHSMEGHC